MSLTYYSQKPGRGQLATAISPLENQPAHNQFLSGQDIISIISHNNQPNLSWKIYHRYAIAKTAHYIQQNNSIAKNSGCTLSLVSFDNNYVRCDWLGDSPVILFSCDSIKKKITPLLHNPAHDTNNINEIQRVKLMGAEVTPPYFQSKQTMIQMSRALGDTNIPFISHKPDGFEHKIKEQTAILMASDGIDPILNNPQTIESSYNKYHNNLQSFVDYLASKSYEQWQNCTKNKDIDDISVLFSLLPMPNSPKNIAQSLILLDGHGPLGHEIVVLAAEALELNLKKATNLSEQELTQEIENLQNADLP